MKYRIYFWFSFLFILHLNVNAQNVGCMLSASKTESITTDYDLLTSSGDHNIDYLIDQEIAYLRVKFGANPAFYYFKDKVGSENAFAAPEIVDELYEDGTVCLGINMLNKGILQSIRGTAVPIIIAHEFGHVIDFKYGVINARGKRAELFADFCAGAFMFVRNTELGYVDIKSCQKVFYGLGDFSSVDHHGTPIERYNALNAGFMAASNTVYSGQYFGIDQLIQSALFYLRNTY